MVQMCFCKHTISEITNSNLMKVLNVGKTSSIGVKEREQAVLILTLTRVTKKIEYPLFFTNWNSFMQFICRCHSCAKIAWYHQGWAMRKALSIEENFWDCNIREEEERKKWTKVCSNMNNQRQKFRERKEGDGKC